MLGDLRETIKLIEDLMLSGGHLKSKDKKIIRIQNHLRAAKSVAADCTNDAVIARWLLTLVTDYDRLCHYTMYSITPRERRRHVA